MRITLPARWSVGDLLALKIMGLLVLQVMALSASGRVYNMHERNIETAETAAMEVRGKVTDAEDGSALPGVNVIEKGTTNGTTTNADGHYKLTVSDANAVLVFSFIGYTTHEIGIGSRTSIDVALQGGLVSLGEVVVVGYGEQKRQNLTGSVATIENKELQQSPVANLSNAVGGRVPGLIVQQTSGEPGSDGAVLLIRGVSTLGNAAPLYVIDGIPRQASDFAQLSASEIESFTILKDAASSAVFGVRGANGVILVTTKRGKTGKTGFSYSVNYGIQQPTRLPTFLDSYGYATLYNEANRNDGNPETYTADDLQKFRDGTSPDTHPNTDWFKTVLKHYSPMVQHNLNLHGGSDKVRYFVSLGYLDQKGLYETVEFRRYNWRSNIDANVTPTTMISVDLAGRVEDRKYPGADINSIFSSLVRVPPVVPARWTSTGELAYLANTNNPLGRAMAGGYRKEPRTVLLNRLVITQQLPFIEGLSVKGVASFDKTYVLAKNWIVDPQYYQRKPDGTFTRRPVNPSTLYESSGQYNSLTLEAHLAYARTFGRHDVSALLLYTQNKTGENSLSASRGGFLSNTIEQISVGDPALQQTGGTATQSTRQGYVGRINYTFNNTYMAEANFRYDGSDNFASGNKFGFFPSFSLGWVLTEESFLKGTTMLNFAKLRASYGTLGNDRLRDRGGNEIRRYPYLATYSYGDDYVLGGGAASIQKGVYETGLAAEATSWEKSTKTNIGVEARLLENKISFETDFFLERRTGILAQRNISIPATLGAQLPVENIGIVENKGVEMSLGYEGSLHAVNFFVRGNTTFVRNKLVYIDEPEATNPLISITGRSLNQQVGLVALGLFQSQDEIQHAPTQFERTNLKPGDIRYADINNDGIINNEDRTVIGKSNIPQVMYGLTLGAKYKDFDVSILLQGAGQSNQYIDLEAGWAFFNGGKCRIFIWTDGHRKTPAHPIRVFPLRSRRTVRISPVTG